MKVNVFHNFNSPTMEQFNAPSVENVYVGNLLFSFACAHCYILVLLLLLLLRCWCGSTGTGCAQCVSVCHFGGVCCAMRLGVWLVSVVLMSV